jgi:hypothetical protein
MVDLKLQVKTNKDKIVKMSVMGEVASPVSRSAYRITRYTSRGWRDYLQSQGWRSRYRMESRPR